MELTEFLPLVSRWFHVFMAMILIGGTVFLRCAVVPLSQLNHGKDNDDIFDLLRGRWAKLVMASILFLLISGLYNAACKAMDYQLDKTYLVLLSIKIVLALIIFFLVSVLSGRSGLAVKFRSAGASWYNITIAAMVLLVCIAGYMKMSPQSIKAKKLDVTVQTNSQATGSFLDPDFDFKNG